MGRVSKRMKQGYENISRDKPCSLQEALDQLAQFPKVKFDETVELHFHLTVDPKKTEQIVRGTVLLPHGTGKKIRLAVFTKGEQASKAKELNADFVGAEDLMEKVEKGFLGFDCVIASPDMMRELSKLGRILGPRGLMPSPKAGTVSTDIEKAIKDVRAGKIEFKSDKQAGIHVGIGKRTFSSQQLLENAEKLISAVNRAKSSEVKGDLCKSICVSSSMGPGIKVAL